ncbi:class I histocompatibility antigen, F10 alpha chain-like isoform X2 [Chiloscyllium punctatum]|uniref:class I histocompatibility antigen, F10 alpha chain-like isoform X2 n=1 Tax=Chiloscyllium punctatum TaxID=137246 RepID=UPI003B635090
MLLILFSISLCFSRVSPDANTFSVIFTAVSGIYDMPEVIGIAMVNGIQIDYFDTKLNQTIPKLQFMADSFGVEYWKYITSLVKTESDIAKQVLDTMMKSTNQTTGIHIFQWIRSVEMNEDDKVRKSSTKRSMRFGFDGEDYISLEPDRMRWVASNDKAVKIKEKWDSDESWNKSWKEHLEEVCVQYLMRYLQAGKKYFKRKVQPEVFISRREPSRQDKPLTLSCLVTGFYPVDIEVTWLRNGEVMSETQSSGIRPNHDGTHQIQKEIEINAGDEDQYSCQIEHSSLTEAQLYQWEILENNWGRSHLGSVIASMIILLAVIVGIMGIIIRKRPWRGSPSRTYTTAPTSEVAISAPS